MRMQYTDDPPDDWDAYCRAQDKAMEKLPWCEICGHRIEDERCYHLYGGYVCEDCIEKAKVWTEDVLED